MIAQLGRCLFGALLIFTVTTGARAEDAALSLALGHVRRLMVERAFETVMIGDPLIVDVRVDDDHSLIIDPLNPGVTNLILVDAGGIVTANIRVLVCAAWSNACAGRVPSDGADVETPPSISRDARRAELDAWTASSGS